MGCNQSQERVSSRNPRQDSSDVPPNRRVLAGGGDEEEFEFCPDDEFMNEIASRILRG